jgi:curved DNA-binding protein CbpA
MRRCRRYNPAVPAKRSPYAVLGVDVDASPSAIKTAWRKLARENHPDLTGGDAAAARRATRQMAEINAAYEELRDPARRRAAADRARGEAARESAADGRTAPGGTTADGTAPRRSGPPRPKPGRPVTGRLDTSDTFTPRNTTLRHDGPIFRPTAVPPDRDRVEPREPPRASDPTGPLSRARMRHFRPPPGPTLEEARDLPVEFGKFHGHTLGEIAAFEPSYIDWIASTITKDRELVAAARVIKEDLDARGVPRIRRAPRAGTAPTL